MKRYFVHKKHIITSIEPIQGSAILETYNSYGDVSYGVGKDGDMIAYKLHGDPEIISEGSLDDYVQVSFNIEDMAQGYMDMGDINLGMASEGLHMENEAETTISELLSGNENNEDESK